MNNQLLFSQKASKKYQKFTSKNKILEKRMIVFFKKLAENPFDKSLQTHKVSLNSFGEVNSSSITGDLRAIWEFSDNQIIIHVLDIGGHSGKQGVYE